MKFNLMKSMFTFRAVMRHGYMTTDRIMTFFGGGE
jgi:hypothetical protein